MKRMPRKLGTAFTLVELMVVVAVVAMLAGMLLPVFSAARLQSDRAVALGQMRQIFGGVTLFASEHNNRFPGPLWPGQIPLLDPAQSGRLAVVLAPYLGIVVPATPQLVPLFIPPAYQQTMGTAFLTGARTYVMNMAVPVANSGVVNPWGNITLAGQTPGTMAGVPGTVWAFSDADQLHPRVVNAPWKAYTPPRIIHGANRLAIFFNGSAGPVTEDELALPVSP
jgi:prepilin-type N-terminal cleavage/methylation domain-containing protein